MIDCLEVDDYVLDDYSLQDAPIIALIDKVNEIIKVVNELAEDDAE